MDDAKKKELEEKLRKYLKDFSLITKRNLESKGEILNEKIRGHIDLYSNSIRNLGIISGVVAPFSLTLLNVDRLDVNIVFLITGFVLLITNIAFSEMFLRTKLENENFKLNKANLEWIFASVHKDTISDEKMDFQKRMDSMDEYTKSTRALDKLLGLESLDIEKAKIINDLKKSYKWMNLIFLLGCACIVASTFFNPLIIPLFKS